MSARHGFTTLAVVLACACGSQAPDDDGGSAPLGCTRAGLQAAVDAYLAGLAVGNYQNVPLAYSATYSENDNQVGFGQGIWEDPIEVAFHRSLFDLVECASFSEIIVTHAAHPYVLGARIDVAAGEISNVSVLVTDDGDWLFDADGYLLYSEPEDWSLVPESDRLSRERLHADAASYFEHLGKKDVEVPWGMPCARLEGGAAYTPTSCDTPMLPETDFESMPHGYLVDREYGMVASFVGTGTANSHLFRILKTGIRYVHTLTEQ